MGHYLKSKPGSIEEAVSSVQSRPFIEDKEAYTKFFNAALKKFKVKSPAEFKSDEEKKKFFDYIDKNYKSDAEKKTGKEDPKESKTLTGKKMSEVETNKIDEGTTKLPDSMAEFRAIADMMKKPIKAKDANKAISKYIVDDSMAVGIQNIAKKNPNADARPVIAKVFNKLKIYTKGEPSYGSTIKFNRKFEISDRDQKKYLDRPSSKDLGNMGFVKTEGFDDDLISLASKHISEVWGEAVEEKMKMEQRRVPDATIKKFADMTDKNQHTEVRLQIAKIVGDKNLIKKYEKLKKDQDKAGSLTGTLQRTRQTLDKELLSKAFDELGNARQVMGAL